MMLKLPPLAEKYAGAPLMAVPTDELRLLIRQVTRLYQAATDELRRRERKAAARAGQATKLLLLGCTLGRPFHPGAGAKFFLDTRTECVISYRHENADYVRRNRGGADHRRIQRPAGGLVEPGGF